MKKLFLCLLCFALILPAVAQRHAGLPTRGRTAAPRAATPPPARQAALTDTLYPPALGLECGEEIFLLPGFDAQNNYVGYIGGTNAFNDTEKLQKYGYAPGATLRQVLVEFGYTSGNPATTLTGVVYAPDSNGAPGTLLGTSAPVRLDEVTTTLEVNDGLTSFTFDSPLTLPDSFFVGFTVPTTAGSGDTVAVFSTEADCYAGGQTAWERHENGQFFLFDDGTADTWGVRVELMIYPVVEAAPTAAAGFAPPLALTAYPNPTTGQVALCYVLNQPATPRVTVYDLTGRSVLHHNPGRQAAGRQQVELDLTPLRAGVYHCTLHAPDGAAVTRLTVTR